MHKYKGFSFVIDGLDGIGKGTAIKALEDYFLNDGKKVFSLDGYQMKHSNYPDIDQILEYDIFFSSEPAYALVGKLIREVLISKNSDKSFSAKSVAEAYALDRRIYLELFEVPLLKAGKTIIRSRSLASSLVYQPLQAKNKDVTIEYILSLQGNRFELENSPNVLIIPTINEIGDLMQRLDKRDKKDDSIFENLEFQLKIKPLFESGWLKKIFEDEGTVVDYFDAGRSIEFTQAEIVRLFEKYF